MTASHHFEVGDSNLTERDRCQRKFCQTKMTDFVRITVLVIPLAVNLMSPNENGQISLHNERHLTDLLGFR